MKPLADISIGARGPHGHPHAERVARVTLVVSLVIGLMLVSWRALARRDAVRARARAEVLAHGRAVELEFSQAVTVAEVLGTLVKQSGGAPSNFQQLGAELMAAHPGVASLELQPGGVVTDIVPRTGREKLIGVNVLKDPASREAAQAAIRARALTVTGPVSLPGGEPGLVVRMPVFQRGRDGRDGFWGFAVASLRLPEALGRAGLDGLYGLGYGYLLYTPQTQEQKIVRIAGRGWSPSQPSVEEPIHAGNLELRLAIQPRIGWFGRWRVVLECVVVVALSILLSLLVAWQEKWRDLKATRGEFSVRLAGLTKDRERTQNELWAVKEAAASVRTQLTDAEKIAADLRERLDVANRALQETAQASATKLSEADQTIRGLEARLEATAGAEARVVELTALLAAAQETIARTKDTPPRDSAIIPPEPVTPPEESPNGLPQPQESPSALPQPQEPECAPPLPSPPPNPPKPHRVARRKKPPQDYQLTLCDGAMPSPEIPAPAQPLPPPPPAPADENLPETIPPAATAQPQATLPPPAPPDLAGEPPVPASPAPETNPEGEHPSAVSAAAVWDAEGGATRPSEAASPALEQPKTGPKPKGKPSNPRAEPPGRPVRLSLLRLAVKQIAPLLIDGDPGAKDCLRDHRAVFRPAFAPGSFEEFEQCVKKGELSAALEHLRKAVKRHGISV